MLDREESEHAVPAVSSGALARPLSHVTDLEPIEQLSADEMTAWLREQRLLYASHGEARLWWTPNGPAWILEEAKDEDPRTFASPANAACAFNDAVRDGAG